MYDVLVVMTVLVIEALQLVIILLSRNQKSIRHRLYSIWSNHIVTLSIEKTILYTTHTY